MAEAGSQQSCFLTESFNYRLHAPHCAGVETTQSEMNKDAVKQSHWVKHGLLWDLYLVIGSVDKLFAAAWMGLNRKSSFS